MLSVVQSFVPASQKRLPFLITTIPLSTLLTLLIPLILWHLLPLPTSDPPDPPTPLLTRLLEEFLIILETPLTRFREVSEGPPAGKSIGGGEDQKEEVFQVVEADWCEQSDGEVGEAPDDD